MADDFELLREYSERGSDDAFRTLVERHSGMVHGAALRLLHDPEIAAEVTQAVFIILARKAGRLSPRTILAGWLYRTARFVALEARRAEHRRQRHQEEYVQMKDSPETASVWERIAPHLEEAIHGVRSTDRAALVLRFFEEKSFAEVATALGTSESAAKMRVGRALEKLRGAFARRGISVHGSLLLTALTAYGASSAPTGLSATVATAALTRDVAGGATLLALVRNALRIMAWHRAKTGLMAVAVAFILGSAGVEIWHLVASSAASHELILASLQPMAGDWDGTFEARTGGIPATIAQPVSLQIRTTPGERSCAIEMRVTVDGGQIVVYRFTHSLNAAGTRIWTVDDPQIARLGGEGVITESVGSGNNGEWRVGFQTLHLNGQGFANCRWVRKSDQLIIQRHDRVNGPVGPSDLFSDLSLRRRVEAKIP